MPVQPSTSTNVLTLRARRAPRSVEAIRADMLVHTDALRALTTELAGAVGGGSVSPTSREEDTLSLKEAAHAAGWSVATLRRHLVRENARNPLDPLGFQPGGLPGSPWRIRQVRLRRYVRNRDQT